MIDDFTIFHRSGLVLYHNHNKSANVNPLQAINSLITNVLLEERSANNQYSHDNKYTIKWSFHNELELVFVAIYLNLNNLLFMDDLLLQVNKEFSNLYEKQLKLNMDDNSSLNLGAFDKNYNRIVSKFEEDMLLSKLSRKSNANKPRTYDKTQKAKDNADQDIQRNKNKNKKIKVKSITNNINNNDEEESEEEGEEQADSGQEQPITEQSTPPKSSVTQSTQDQPKGSPATSSPLESSTAESETKFNPDKLKLLQQRKAAPQRTGPPKKKGVKATESAAAEEIKEISKPAKSKKPQRESDKLSKDELAALDYSSKLDSSAKLAADADKLKQYVGEVPQDSSVYEYEEEQEEEEESAGEESAEEAESVSNQGKSSGLFGFFKNLVGQKELTREDLEPILRQFKDQLMVKNVAADIVEELGESIVVTLVGKKLGSFTTIKSTVKLALEAALTRILTPTKQVDFLQGIATAQEEKRPYSVVFLGVNGVGKFARLQPRFLLIILREYLY
jgi:signal recognition particle receptor subunit alpha